MANTKIDIVILGVGGQGIGLLSEVLVRALDRAGIHAVGADTHGVAQRGATVISCLRVGDGVQYPLVESGRADLLLALERTEALRGMEIWLRRGGRCIYYDTNWQSYQVRRGSSKDTTIEMLETRALEREIKLDRVYREDLPDSRMQNLALLGSAVVDGVFPGLTLDNVLASLDDLMTGPALEKNRLLLTQISGG